MGEGGTSKHRHKYVAYVRLATREDIPIARSFIYNLAMEHDSECLMTEAILERELFREPPLHGLTIFILELDLLPVQASAPEEEAPRNAQEFPSTTGSNQSNSADCSLQSGASFPILLQEVIDVDRKLFSSPVHKKRVIVGHMCVIPSYYSRAAMAALRVEDIYIRDAYRRQGLGRILMSTVARIASTEGIGRVDWLVHRDNRKAIDFYKSMGATIVQEMRTVKLYEGGIKSLAKRS